MSTKANHLELTAESMRGQDISLATVVGMRNESSTVKSVLLKVHEKNVSFKAGQWVDVFLPEVETVGGFSMCSSPGRLKSEGKLELAVKYSEHPPSKWIHQKCGIGSNIHIRVGGDVFYDPNPNKPTSDLLLIAGGIGINPIYSILCHVEDLLQSSWMCPPHTVSLLYSASSREELIFHERIQERCDRHNDILSYQSFVTREKLQNSHSIAERRISSDDIKNSLVKMDLKNTLVYICGPPPMIEDMDGKLKQCGVCEDHIHYEKWW